MRLSLPLHLLLAACALCTAAPLHAQTELSVGHFAPGASTLSIELDGTAIVPALDYAQLEARIATTPGRHVIRALRPDGSTLAEREIRWNPHDRFTIFVAGNGSERDPYQLVPIVDSDLPISGEHEVLVQQVTLELQSATDTGSTLLHRVEHWLGDMQGLHEDQVMVTEYPLDTWIHEGWLIANAMSLHASRIHATVEADLQPPRHASLDTEPLQRVLLVFAGDGTTEPYAPHLFRQGVERARPTITASETLDGMWTDPRRPGSLVLLAHTAGTDATGGNVRGIIMTSGPDGNARWHRFANGTMLAVLGGSPDGDRATAEFLDGFARVDMHSCSEATLTAFGPSWTIPGTADVSRLYKLLPSGSCEATVTESAR